MEKSCNKKDKNVEAMILFYTFVCLYLLEKDFCYSVDNQ